MPPKKRSKATGGAPKAAIAAVTEVIGTITAETLLSQATVAGLISSCGDDLGSSRATLLSLSSFCKAVANRAEDKAEQLRALELDSRGCSLCSNTAAHATVTLLHCKCQDVRYCADCIEKLKFDDFGQPTQKLIISAWDLREKMEEAGVSRCCSCEELLCVSEDCRFEDELCHVCEGRMCVDCRNPSRCGATDWCDACNDKYRCEDCDTCSGRNGW